MKPPRRRSAGNDSSQDFHLAGAPAEAMAAIAVLCGSIGAS
jgi:hypothetical protein